MEKIGIVVIGRNEGNRLYECLNSVMGEGRFVIYVDSGSTDRSVELAQSLSIDVVRLDSSIPYTAARGRNAGFEYLLQVDSSIEFVQFVDGDCIVVKGWIELAYSTLVSRPDVVAVFGRRREQFPERSIYNLLCDIEWDTPVGETKTCGGDVMMRAAAFKQVGGFNSNLIAGEEPELCVRLRWAGGKILRLDAEMTLHDAKMTSFSQWWKRSLRTGHAYSEGAWLHGSSPERHWVKESQRIWFWGLFLPLIAIITTGVTRGYSLLFLLIAYVLLAYRVGRAMQQQGLGSKEASLYGLFCVLCKFPQVQGQIKFHLSRLLRQDNKLIEYKA